MGMAYTLMAYKVTAYIIMALKVMAYIVMARSYVFRHLDIMPSFELRRAGRDEGGTGRGVVF